MQAAYPVRYAVLAPGRFSRLQLLIRFVAFLAVGTLGLSFGAVFAFFYLALPAYAATRLAADGDAPGSYIRDGGPPVLAVLRWIAAVSAWIGLVAVACRRGLPKRPCSSRSRARLIPRRDPR